MSESGDSHHVKVNDRRRFDAQGNAREDAPAPVDAQAPAAEDPAPAAPSSGELDAARARIDELARAYQALLKEREEFKVRINRERDRLVDVERGNVAQVLLDAVDELDRCLESAPANDPMAQGVRFIRDGMLSKLANAGVERLEVVGLPFDPNVAEAADMEVTPDPAADQRMTALVRAGYRLKDRVIRPARVRVAKYVKPADA